MTSKEIKIPLSQIDSLLYALSQRPCIEIARAQETNMHKLIMKIFITLKRMKKNDIRELKRVKQQIAILTKQVIFYSKIANKDYPEFDMWILSVKKQLDVYEKKYHNDNIMLILNSYTY